MLVGRGAGGYGNAMVRENSANMPVHAHESRARSLAKAVSWRFVGTLDTLILSFLVLTFLAPLLGARETATQADNLHTAGYIAIAEVITKTLLYFLHERFWSRMRWAVWTWRANSPAARRHWRAGWRRPCALRGKRARGLTAHRHWSNC